jgi:DnaJ-class molecular chaperone
MNIVSCIVLAVAVCISRAENYYKILGVKNTATDNEIKIAYKKLAIEWHPDRNKIRREEAEKEFIAIGKAYDVLRDKEKRKAYDLQLNGNSSSGKRFGTQTFQFTQKNGNLNTDILKAFNLFNSRNAKQSAQFMSTDHKAITPEQVQKIFQQMFRSNPVGKY